MKWTWGRHYLMLKSIIPLKSRAIKNLTEAVYDVADPGSSLHVALRWLWKSYRVQSNIATPFTLQSGSLSKSYRVLFFWN
ncbi:hypothetical protein P8452_77927 [Trifolium repens]|nr:hypothetical protein P8452_77927 [Trifolium repens]